MSAPYDTVVPGQQFGFPAVVYNEMLGALAQCRSLPKRSLPDREWDRVSPVEIYVNNTTGSNLGRFNIVKVATPSIASPTDIESWAYGRLLDAEAPTASSFIAITQEPILNGYCGKAVIAGITPVLVNISNAAHTYCVPGTSTTQLSSAAAAGTNGTKILYKSAASGASTKCVINLPFLPEFVLTAGTSTDVTVVTNVTCAGGTFTLTTKTLHAVITLNGTDYPIKLSVS